MKVPKHEAEVIKAGAKRYWGDEEKVPTTAVKQAIVSGVSLDSRYNKAAELEEMARMVAEVPMRLRPKLRSIFCDSKAGSAYIVHVSSEDADEAEHIARQLENATKGHNGIEVVFGKDEQLWLDPYWPGENLCR